MQKKILRPNGKEYMTVAAEGGQIFFKNFSEHRVSVIFDANILDQLIPFLTEANFWNKLKEKSNETCN